MTGNVHIRTILLLAFAVLANGCDRPADIAQEDRGESGDGQKNHAEAADLSRVFMEGTEAEVIRVIQDGTDFSGTPDMKWFSMLSDIWYEREASHPTFKWSVLRGPRVKVETGSQLAQAYRNGLIPLNTDDLRGFALENYGSPDNRVARPSVVLIGELGDARDIDLLAQLARSGAGGRRLFKEGVTALSYMCSSKAEQAIETLMSQASADDQSFARALLSNREHVLRSWCR